MRYLLGVQNDESIPMPTGAEWDASFARVGVVDDEMRSTGIWVFAGGLLPSVSATVVRVENGATAMTDGPFTETKEQLAGFWIIDVDDLDAALAWAGKCAEACRAPIEVRPFDNWSQT